jgi:hypothetical protein
MHEELESVASDYHIALGALHGFAAFFFGRRALRHYNAWKPRRGLLWLLAWCAFHLICTIVSFIASRIHARETREST